jgi:DNA-directed RNA polymerase subunit RPC12/RpoP
VKSSSSTKMSRRLRVVRFSAKCTLLGHKVDHTRIARKSCTRCVRCGAAILDQGPTVSRIAHTLSCFFGWHRYIFRGKRAEHNEYVCERCGHTLLFELGSDRYSRHNEFKKKVSYICGLLGHRVHVVKKSSKATEYACRCGHPFLKAQADLKVIRHPMRCVVLGHYVTVNHIDGLWAEYVCLRCGHPFCFKLTACELESDLESNLEQPLHV